MCLFINTRQKDFPWKQRAHYGLENGSEQNSIFKYTTMGPMIPKEMKYNLHYVLKIER